MTFAFFRRTRVRVRQPSVRSLRTNPNQPTPGSVSIVVPVRDNAAGISRIVSWWTALPRASQARELVIVDDGSLVPLVINAPGCVVIRTPGRGPAAARNLGWRAARGEWIAFMDSDCLPDDRWPSAFASDWSGEIAIQGRVRSLGVDVLSSFYDSQGILRPMAWTPEGRPRYLVTANALVWREALEAVNGFDESFPLAAGEDVDLGLRLGQVGTMRWCEDASVAHEFEPSIVAFVKRFIRYGRGNRTLAERVESELEQQLRPRPFAARSGRLRDHGLALVAFSGLSLGWWFEVLVGSE